MYFEISREFFLHKRVMDQIDISSEDLEDGEVPDSDEDITIINIVPLEKSKILRYLFLYYYISICNTELSQICT